MTNIIIKSKPVLMVLNNQLIGMRFAIIFIWIGGQEVLIPSYSKIIIIDSW